MALTLLHGLLSSRRGEADMQCVPFVCRQETEGDDKSGFRRVERAFGEFVRRFQLPDNTDPEHISAKVENGA